MHRSRGGNNRRSAGPAAALDGLAIEARAFPPRRIIHFIADGRIDDPGYRHAVLDHGQRYGPAVLTAQEATGAVDRVDHENPLAIEAAGIVDRLFAEPAI